MSLNNWLQNLPSAHASGLRRRYHGRCGSHRAARHWPSFEVLEDRRLLAFSPVTSFPVGTTPRVVVTADFNNDGRLDLATENYDGTAGVLLGDGEGGFGDAYQFAAWSFSSLAVADFNNDGNLDLATIGGNAVGVLLGNSDCTFLPPVKYDGIADGASLSVATGDLNADGNADLVCTFYFISSDYDPDDYYSAVEVLLGNGRGGFANQYEYRLQGFYPKGLAVADLNADGNPDVVRANRQSDTVSVLMNDGDGWLGYYGGLSYYPTDFATGQSPFAVAVGDFTGDGIPDLVTAGLSVDVLPGLGDGTFAPPSHHSTNGSELTTVAAADFSGDGKLDVVTADLSAGTVCVRLGWVDGTAGSLPRAVAVGDFNGDGRPDVAAVDRGLNAVSVLLNDGVWGQINPNPLPGDYNANGIVDAADYTTWRDAMTAGAMELANDSMPGIVDESDFLYWRAHFGETMGTGSGSVQAAPATDSQSVMAEHLQPQTVALSLQEPQQNTEASAAAPIYQLQSSNVLDERMAAPIESFTAIRRSPPQVFSLQFTSPSNQAPPLISSHDELQVSIRARALLDFLAFRPGNDHPIDAHVGEKLPTSRGHDDDSENYRVSHQMAIDRYLGQFLKPFRVLYWFTAERS